MKTLVDQAGKGCCKRATGAKRKEARDAILRQLVMLQLVPAHPRHITVQQIRSRLSDIDRVYEVSPRTIERNMMSLMSVFPALAFEETATGNRWFWADLPKGGRLQDYPKISDSILERMIAANDGHGESLRAA